MQTVMPMAVMTMAVTTMAIMPMAVMFMAVMPMAVTTMAIMPMAVMTMADHCRKTKIYWPLVCFLVLLEKRHHHLHCPMQLLEA